MTAPDCVVRVRQCALSDTEIELILNGLQGCLGLLSSAMCSLSGRTHDEAKSRTKKSVKVKIDRVDG